MEIKRRETIYLQFSPDEAMLIDSLIREQFGKKTVEEIMDSFSYVFGWYRALFNLIPRICHGQKIEYDTDEYNVLSSIISKAYNDGKHESQKDMLQSISDAMKVQRDAFMAI